MKITIEIQWDMGHRVPNHDSACRNLHGHRYRALICFDGEIIKEQGDSSEGMVYDFGKAKKICKSWIDEKLDHGMLLYEKDYFCERIDTKLLIVPFIPTAENIAQYLFKNLSPLVPVKISQIQLFETPNFSATYENS